MNKIALSIITLGLILGIGFMIFGNQVNNGEITVLSNQNIEVKDGVQYVTINAKGGYSPRITSAQSNVPTKLIIKTNGTYDCSVALVIRSIGYQKILPQTGEEVIDIGEQKSGTSLQGTCSMGMYNFEIEFI